MEKKTRKKDYPYLIAFPQDFSPYLAALWKPPPGKEMEARVNPLTVELYRSKIRKMKHPEWLIQSDGDFMIQHFVIKRMIKHLKRLHRMKKTTYKYPAGNKLNRAVEKYHKAVERFNKRYEILLDLIVNKELPIVETPDRAYMYSYKPQIFRQPKEKKLFNEFVRYHLETHDYCDAILRHRLFTDWGGAPTRGDKSKIKSYYKNQLNFAYRIVSYYRKHKDESKTARQYRVNTDLVKNLYWGSPKPSYWALEKTQDKFQEYKPSTIKKICMSKSPASMKKPQS